MSFSFYLVLKCYIPSSIWGYLLCVKHIILYIVKICEYLNNQITCNNVGV